MYSDAEAADLYNVLNPWGLLPRWAGTVSLTWQ